MAEMIGVEVFSAKAANCRLMPWLWWCCSQSNPSFVGGDLGLEFMPCGLGLKAFREGVREEEESEDEGEEQEHDVQNAIFEC